MDPYAEATCVLKVNSNCQACKMKTMEILGSVCGMYDFDINAQEGSAKLQAVVEPNLFLKALAGTGPHAEPKWVKLRHPKVNRSYDTYNSYSNGYNALDTYNHGRALPNYSYHTMEPTYPHYHGSNPYYHGSNSYYNGSDPYYHGLNSYYYGSGLPSARRRGPFHY